MYNFHKSFEHENFKARQWNFYGLSKAIRKQLFTQPVFFIYFLNEFDYKLYYYTHTLSLEITEHNILIAVEINLTLTGFEPWLLPSLHV